MMNYQIKTVVHSDEQEDVVSVLTAAFCSDPAARWMYPSSRDYLRHFPAFVRGFGGPAFHQQTAHLAEDSRGAALWLPPGASPDEEELDALFQSTLPPKTRGEMMLLLEQMAAHHPSEAHWHLPMIGVDPRHQARGCGSALLAHVLVRCDQEQAIAHLEASNPVNIPLYERHGFRRVGEIRAGTCPPVIPMTRTPRRRG